MGSPRHSNGQTVNYEVGNNFTENSTIHSGVLSHAPTHSLPRDKSSDLHQSQEWHRAKAEWTCLPQSNPWRRHWLHYNCPMGIGIIFIPVSHSHSKYHDSFTSWHIHRGLAWDSYSHWNYIPGHLQYIEVCSPCKADNIQQEDGDIWQADRQMKIGVTLN